jgi:hypothetical protein
MSADSQIGTTRAVRDRTMEHLQTNSWNWKQHVRLVQQVLHSCNDGTTLIARTLHVELDVPWFLRDYSRYSTMDPWALKNPEALPMGTAKGIIQVPCSVERATLGKQNGKQLRAIMEYGHGLFYHRGEVQDDFLSEYVSFFLARLM